MMRSSMRVILSGVLSEATRLKNWGAYRENRKRRFIASLWMVMMKFSRIRTNNG